MSQTKILSDLDKIFRKAYTKEFGKNAFETGFKEFSKEEMVDRYARNIIFWEKQKDRFEVKSTKGFTDVPKVCKTKRMNMNKLNNPFIMHGFTVCTQQRMRLFETCENHNILEEVIERINTI